MVNFPLVSLLPFVFPGLLSFLVSLSVTPLIIRLMWKTGTVDDPRNHKHPKVIHTSPVPRGGGLVIFLAVFLGLLWYLPLDRHLIGIILGALVVVGVGLWDDRYDLSPYTRLALNLVAALVVVGSGIGIAFVSNPFGGVIPLDQPQIKLNVFGETRNIWVLADLFAVGWIVSLMNVVNWSSGVDGQLAGVVPIAAIVIGLLSLGFGGDVTQWPVVVLAFITAGAYLGFLPYSAFPQKIMPGYSGASLGGYLLAVMAILSTAKVGTLMVVLGVPILDGVYAVSRRLASGRSPVWGDRGHLHHKMLDAGFSKRSVAWIYWGVTLFLGILALNLNSKQKVYTMVSIAAIIGVFLIWVNLFTMFSKPRGRDNGLKT